MDFLDEQSAFDGQKIITCSFIDFLNFQLNEFCNQK